MKQPRKKNGRFSKKVKSKRQADCGGCAATPSLPFRNRKIAVKLMDNHRETVEHLLALAMFSAMLLKRLQEVERKIRIYPTGKKSPQ